jgi:Xaa-Pro aminopeptidase
LVDIGKMQEAIHRENLGGWLFCTLKSRDKLSLSILDLDPETKNTRPWYYFIFAEGEPLKIQHGIEPHVLDGLPGTEVVYRSREELLSLLRNHAAQRLRARPLACQFSPEIPIISYIDHGTALLLETEGFRLASSASLLQRFRGLLNGYGIRSHREAADHLYEIVGLAWDRVRQAFLRGETLFEEDIGRFFLSEFDKRKLHTDSPPTAAVGPNSGNPHYSISGKGAVIEADRVLQFDLWAKQKTPEGIYADISWVGFTGPVPPPRVEKDFSCLLEARDETVRFIEKAFAEGNALCGADVDGYTRKRLRDAGYEETLRHRTGHGIDREVHGSGVNLDSVEFPDHRLLLDGSCFSVEPGIYFSEYGLRTEIDVYIDNGRPVVSGGAPQSRLLTL